MWQGGGNISGEEDVNVTGKSVTSVAGKMWKLTSNMYPNTKAKCFRICERKIRTLLLLRLFACD